MAFICDLLLIVNLMIREVNDKMSYACMELLPVGWLNMTSEQIRDYL